MTAVGHVHDHAHGHAHDHAHGHEHGHVHGHVHGHEHEPGGALESYDHVQGGMPVLDIGGDVGALVATMDDDALGTELYLRADRDPSLSVHTGVWRRNLGSGTIAAAVFLELLEGTYRIDEQHTTGPLAKRIESIEISGGELAAVDLRRTVAGPDPVHLQVTRDR